MIINSQGFGHFTKGLNNQDFGIETSRMVLVLDGCSEAKYSELGTRLFGQLFSKVENCDDVEMFEENVKNTFEDILEMMKNYYTSSEEFEQEFIMENLLFTIIALFETESEFVVKLFGDGYIITQNAQNNVSFMRHYYDKRPPYFAYKYCQLKEFKDYQFKTFKFSKEHFKQVAIATDGVMPIARGELKGIDDLIFDKGKIQIENEIRNQRQLFFDDITIGVLGGKA